MGAQGTTSSGLTAEDVIGVVSAFLALVAVVIACISVWLSKQTVTLAVSAAREERSARNLERFQRLVSPLRELQIAATAAAAASGGEAHVAFRDSHQQFATLLATLPSRTLPKCTAAAATGLSAASVRTLASDASTELQQALEAERKTLASFV